MATNAPWGSGNTAANRPIAMLNTMKSAGYANTYNDANNGVFGVIAANATSNGGIHQGWVYSKKGTGGAVSLTITNGGSAYAATPGAYTWRLTTGGTAEANGTLTITANVITGYTISNPGAGFIATTGSATVANASGGATLPSGTGGALTVNIGGRAGRTFKEVLVAQAGMTAT